MSRRANRRKVRPPVKKQRKHESLEPRVVMSADPVLSLHGFTEIEDGPPSLVQHVEAEPPAMVQHGAAEPPALVPHVVEEAPSLDHHGGGMGMGFGQEVLESEVVYDADADFWYDSEILFGEDELGGRVEQTLADANALTGQDDVVDTYGFDGTGQTVAVIDSGIAYSHYALGGGLGANYRVVGGWDFTENDANPYDDGGAGSHGTHVAGIVGAKGDGAHSGVATDVDLVGLRVFDDAGNGYFSWVEQALQWVHTNRNNFENPITAVNLSLGTTWNSDSIPGWAMLEDEFAQLEADGIFISVSAGNSYTSYYEKGVSYPAASDYVVPVMSVDNNGQLSYFSQRAEYAIAAPGRSITSTVPDYAANDADTIDDDWLSMSGTSMAAPYVAGASVLIREAMQFVGYTGITQDTIYDHMMATADEFYDSSSSTTYKRLNLWAAIDALMPVDDFGSSQVDAYDLGTFNDTSNPGPLNANGVSGVVSTLDDADCFTFTAGVTGVVTVSASNVTHELVEQWNVWGGDWSVSENGDCVIEVVQGQTYTFSISTTDGLGYYDLSFDVESTFAAIEWGAVGPQETRTGLSVSGEQWYAVTAGRAGYFTAEAIVGAGSATVAIYDAQMNALTSDGARADYVVGQDEMIYLRVTGESADFDLRMTNALTVSGGVATLVGTAGDDAIDLGMGASSYTLSLNGVDYQVANAAASSYVILGGAGTDAFQATCDSGVNNATLRSGSLRLTGTYGSVDASSVEAIDVYGGAGDTATFYDTAGDDQFTSTAQDATMQGASVYTNSAHGFDRTIAYATAGGTDTASMFDTAGNDTFLARPEYAALYSNTSARYSFARGFDAVTATANAGGKDYATFYDSVADDNFVALVGRAQMVSTTAGYNNTGNGFESVIGYSLAGGTDRAVYYDSAGNDTVFLRPEYAVMWDSGATYWHYTSNFERVEAYAKNGGTDRAVLHDSAGDDVLTARDTFVMMRAAAAGGYLNYASGFDRVEAYSLAGGNDVAHMYGSAGDDLFVGRPEFGLMSGSGGAYWNYASGFETLNAVGGQGGTDRAKLFDSVGDDDLYGDGDSISLDGDSYSLNLSAFDEVQATSGGSGTDTVDVDDIDFAFEQIGDWS